MHVMSVHINVSNTSMFICKSSQLELFLQNFRLTHDEYVWRCIRGAVIYERNREISIEIMLLTLLFLRIAYETHSIKGDNFTVQTIFYCYS